MIIDLHNLVEAFASLTQTYEIHVLTWFIGFDILTGLAKGFVGKKANSTKSTAGIIKHLLVVLMVYTVYPYLAIVQAKAIATAFIYFFIACYGISIVENWGQLGLPMPKFVIQYFEKLKRDNDILNKEEQQHDNR